MKSETSSPVLHVGDCRDVLKTYSDDSFTACVTDPPYGLSDETPQDALDRFFRVLPQIVLPDFSQLDPEVAEMCDFGGIPLDGSSLSRRRVHRIVKTWIAMPERPVDLKCDILSGEVEINAGNIPASDAVADPPLGNEIDAEDPQFLGNYLLDARDTLELSETDRAGSGVAKFDSGRLSVSVCPVALSSRPCPLTRLLLGAGDLGFHDVGGDAHAPRKAGTSASVVTRPAAIGPFVLRFDAGRSTAEFCPADRTGEGHTIAEAGSPRLVRTRAATGRLATVLEPVRVSVILDKADGAVSGYFHLWLRPKVMSRIAGILPSGGFMGKGWDHGVPGVDFWREVLRVLKPGAPLLAFGGTRTYHRLVCAIEDAGFEIRDGLMWLYGSGFPKSLDIGKAVTKTIHPEELRTIKEWLRVRVTASGKTPAEINRACGFTACDYLKTDAGNDSAGRATWHLLLPKPDKWQVMQRVIGFDSTYDDVIWRLHKVESTRNAPKECKGIYGEFSGTVTRYDLTDAARLWDGWGTALKPGWEPIVLAMKPLDGTFAHNAMAHGVAGLNVDGCRLEPSGEGRHRVGEASQERRYTQSGGVNFAALPGPRGGDPAGRWPPNVMLDEDAAAMLDEQTGERRGATSNSRHGVQGTCYGTRGSLPKTEGRGDIGGASRFFYCPKASPSDRSAGGKIDNRHPTVKPHNLMRWLCRLVKMPEGTVILDPFMGSGSTGCAAVVEGIDFVGIDLDPEHVEIARQRIAAFKDVDQQSRQGVLF